MSHKRAKIKGVVQKRQNPRTNKYSKPQNQNKIKTTEPQNHFGVGPKKVSNIFGLHAKALNLGHVMVDVLVDHLHRAELASSASEAGGPKAEEVKGSVLV